MRKRWGGVFFFASELETKLICRLNLCTSTVPTASSKDYAYFILFYFWHFCIFICVPHYLYASVKKIDSASWKIIGPTPINRWMTFIVLFTPNKDWRGPNFPSRGGTVFPLTLASTTLHNYQDHPGSLSPHCLYQITISQTYMPLQPRDCNTYKPQSVHNNYHYPQPTELATLKWHCLFRYKGKRQRRQLISKDFVSPNFHDG